MPSSVKKKPEFNDELTHKIQTLIIGRLMAIFLLLVAGWYWNSGQMKLTIEDFPSGDRFKR